MSEPKPASWWIGNQQWMKGSDGWYVQMWGWFPGNTGRPSTQWVKVDDHRVPKELRNK